MTMVLVIALVACTLSILFVVARSRSKRTAEKSLQPLDLKAFRALSDRNDEQLLREKLSRNKFFKLKRQRIQVAWKYVGRISGNAGIVLRMGQAAQTSHDPEVILAAANVVDLATQVRAQCLLAMAKLTVEFAFPSLQLTPALLMVKYEALRDNVSHLGAVQLQPSASLAS